ncbi:MAG: hypothetical protein PHI85_08275 [Victivallaceae bacterium]|nr:hypothetical protein [Victivallaceae bacterium]
MTARLKTALPLAAVLFYTAALNFIYLWSQRFILMRDSYAYLRFAADAAAGSADLSVPAAARPPLLIWILMLLDRCGADPETGGIVIALTATVGAVAAVYFLAMLLFERRFQAAVAAWLATAVPGLFYYGGNILRDPLYWCAALWCAVFFCRALWEGSWTVKRVALNAGLAGVAAGVAVGLRLEWPELAGFMAIAFVAAFFDPERSRRRCCIAAVSAALCAAAVVMFLALSAPSWTVWRPTVRPPVSVQPGEGVE